MREVLPGPPGQVRRLERYWQEHPDVDIQPPGADSAVWRAFRDGNLIAYGFTLMVFLERLEALPEPLGAAQDFGLHLPARHPPLCCRREFQGRGDGQAGMLTRWAARTPGAPRHERTARGSVQLCRDGRTGGGVLAQFMAGMSAGQVTGTAPLPAPAGGNPVQAGDAEGWY